MGEPRATSQERFDARLAELARSGGDLAAYEAALRAVGTEVGEPLRSSALLKLARLGWECYTDFPVEPSPAPPTFLGRSADSLSWGPRTARTDVPRREPERGESTLDYGRYLAADLVARCALTDDERAPAAVYVALLAREDLRRAVGWERSLDAHALMMLTLERAMRRAGGADLSPTLERAFFGWLHRALYDEPSAELLAEVESRREIRLANELRPAGEVAVMVCETPIPDAVPLEGIQDAIGGFVLTLEQVAAVLPAGDAPDAVARRRGLEDTGRLDLRSPGVDADHAAGHLLRWLLMHDVPVDLVRLPLALTYAPLLVHRLAGAQMDEPNAAVAAHLVTIRRIRADGDAVGLSDELLLLAWLTNQTRTAVRLVPLLDARRATLAGLPDSGASTGP